MALSYDVLHVLELSNCNMCCIRVKTFELLKLLDIVGFIVGMFYGCCLWAQVAILLML